MTERASSENGISRYADAKGVELDDEENTDRRYVCTSCKTVVRARWYEPSGFSVGCDCTTVPVVPQMGQAETPDNWRVEREECCHGVDVKELDSCYNGRGQDYECPDCGATYGGDGTMATGPGGGA